MEFDKKPMIVSIVTCLIVGYIVGQSWIGEPTEYAIDRSRGSGLIPNLILILFACLSLLGPVLGLLYDRKKIGRKSENDQRRE